MPEAPKGPAPTPGSKAPSATSGEDLEPAPLAMKLLVLGYYAAVLAAGGVIAARPGMLPDERLLILVVLAGALGGVLHGLTSLAAHAGSGRLDVRWWVFYVARPVVGAGLAFVVVLVLRGGLFGVSVPEGDGGERVLLGWAALAGLFSSPALRKLKDVFDGFGGSSPKAPGGTKPEERKTDATAGAPPTPAP
jgi:hypothetical protein